MRRPQRRQDHVGVMNVVGFAVREVDAERAERRGARQGAATENVLTLALDGTLSARRAIRPPAISP